MRLSIALFIAIGLALAGIVYCRGQNNGGRAIIPLNSSATLLLDVEPMTNGAAYSFARKLRAAYSGPAFAVQHTIGGATNVIGFTGNLVDTNTLLTFANGGTVFLTRVYDQSTTGRDIVNFSEPLEMVESGVIYVDDGNHLRARFTSGLNIFSATAALGTSASSSTFAVFESVSGTQGGLVGTDNIDRFLVAFAASSGTKIFLRNGIGSYVPTAVAMSNGVEYLVTVTWNSSGNDAAALNDSSESAVAAGNANDPTCFSMGTGQFPVGSEKFISEYVFYHQVLSAASKTNVQGNINAFYTLW